MSTRLERRVVAKTGSYTINPTLDRPGTVFTNRGATGAVIFTLPLPTLALTGWHYQVRAHADFAVTVAATVPDTLISLNDVAADSLAASTGSGIIGAVIDAFCDGTQWFVNGAAVGVTYTLAT